MAIFAKHKAAVLIVVFAFIMRLFLAPWTSYWLDEILSVAFYGYWNKSVVDMLTVFFSKSIHPPLYQTILYFWVDVFGDSETATRTLSNLYIAGATIALYGLVLKTNGRRVAIGSIIVFSLMYVTIRYSIESRSYAQTLFLVTLSSLAFYSFVERIRRDQDWRTVFLNRSFFLLTLTNLAVLSTHFYNVFFLAAQALFLLIYLVHVRQGGWLKTVVQVAVASSVPVVIFILGMGAIMLGMYERHSPSFSVSAPSKLPWEIFWDYVLLPNFGFALLLVPIVVGVAALAAQRLGVVVSRPGIRLPARFHFHVYYLLWAVLPCVFAYLLFLVAGAERYAGRYFVFCTPPLAPLVVLGFEQLVLLARRMLKGSHQVRFLRSYVTHALLCFLVLAGVLVMPRGFLAASSPKDDYRGIAQQVAAIVRGDPDHDYVVYEGAPRPLLEHYLSKMGIHVLGTMQRGREQKGIFSFEDQAARIAAADFLIVAFTHDAASQFPLSLARLASAYRVHSTMLGAEKHGVIVYSVAGNRVAGDTTPSQ